MEELTFSRLEKAISENYEVLHFKMWSVWAPEIRQKRLSKKISRRKVCSELNISEDELLNAEYGGIEADPAVYFRLSLYYDGYYEDPKHKQELINIEVG